MLSYQVYIPRNNGFKGWCKGTVGAGQGTLCVCVEGVVVKRGCRGLMKIGYNKRSVGAKLRCGKSVKGSGVKRGCGEF
jgi:hypothetical protein